MALFEISRRKHFKCNSRGSMLHFGSFKILFVACLGLRSPAENLEQAPPINCESGEAVGQHTEKMNRQIIRELFTRVNESWTNRFESMIHPYSSIQKVELGGFLCQKTGGNNCFLKLQDKKSVFGVMLQPSIFFGSRSDPFEEIGGWNTWSLLDAKSNFMKLGGREHRSVFSFKWWYQTAISTTSHRQLEFGSYSGKDLRCTFSELEARRIGEVFFLHFGWSLNDIKIQIMKNICRKGPPKNVDHEDRLRLL